MGWKLLGKPKTQKVTKSLAKQIAEMDPAPHDRPLSERRLAVYERLLTEGSFRPVTWATALCHETSGVYRVNGKHTSTMLSGMKELPEFFVTIEEYECDTLEDVAKLYATFDSGIQSRTARDIYLSFAATVDALKEVSVTSITLSASGIAYHTWHEKYGAHQPAERAELLLEYPEFVVWLDRLFGDGQHDGERSSSKHLRRQPVVAAMFSTYQKAKGQATDFWTAVRDETGMQPTLPDRKLARYLISTGVNDGSGAKRVRKADTREFYVKCIHAWNAWRAGETTNLNYYPDAKIPVVK